MADFFIKNRHGMKCVEVKRMELAEIRNELEQMKVRITQFRGSL